jgi:hypothetical protein
MWSNGKNIKREKQTRKKNMTVKTKLYVTKGKGKGSRVRAIRVTARNFVAVANWSHGTAIEHIDDKGDVSKQRVRVSGLIAQIGDFVCKGEGETKAFRVKDDVFEAQYQLVV